MANFLAEAAALAARAPHVLYEQQQDVLPSRLVAGGNAPQAGAGAAGGAVTGASLLAVAALRQATRVAASAKMPADVRAAVCGYVAGTGEPLAFSVLRHMRQSPCPRFGGNAAACETRMHCRKACKSCVRWPAAHG